MTTEFEHRRHVQICHDEIIAGKCRWYRWPAIHPAQVGPDDVYGCVHPAWGGLDFMTIVACDGDPAKCELPARTLRRCRGCRRGAMTQRANSFRGKQRQDRAVIQACDELLERAVEGESP